MTRTRNISRYEADMGSSYSFSGWRLCITRRKERFVRYFSDREHGGDSDAAFAAALAMRDDILRELGEDDATPSAVFARFRKVYP